MATWCKLLMKKGIKIKIAKMLRTCKSSYQVKMCSTLAKMLLITLSKTLRISRTSTHNLRTRKPKVTMSHKKMSSSWLQIWRRKLSLWLIRSRSSTRETRSQPMKKMKPIMKRIFNLAQTQRKMLTRMITSIIKINRSCFYSNNCLESSNKVTKKEMKPRMKLSEITLISYRLLEIKEGLCQL